LQTVFKHGEKAFVVGDFEKFHRVITFRDDAVVIGVENEKFHNPNSAAVSCVVAAGATHGTPQFARATRWEGHGQVGEDRLGIGVGLTARRAKAADKALAEDPKEASGQKIGWDAQIDQARDGSKGVVGVKGGENQVACEGGTDHEFCSLLIARFSDEDDIGILTQESPETGRKGQTDLFVHLGLANEGKIEFDRILQCEDGSFLGWKFAKGGVEGGGLARACGTCDEDHAVGAVKEGTKFGLHVVRKSKADEFKLEAGAIQQA
jgi:hypothetical protein